MKRRSVRLATVVGVSLIFFLPSLWSGTAQAATERPTPSGIQPGPDAQNLSDGPDRPVKKWRLAKSLIVLRAEVNRLFPNRRRSSDGTIGDARHQRRRSDHNPNRRGVVRALDLTHDPRHGANMGKISGYIITHRHPSLKYVIFNRRIASGRTDWKWVPYHGPHPHDTHMHVSVRRPYDDTSRWHIARAFRDRSAAAS